MRKINRAGIDLIKHFEGVKLTAYRDIANVLTIGYGHTGTDVYAGQTITQQQAEALLLKDLERFEKYVSQLPGADFLNENQFAALVSLAFNVGSFGSGLKTAIAQKNIPGIAAKIGEYNKARVGGVLQVVTGLDRRRKAEIELFNKGALKKFNMSVKALIPFFIFALSRT
jgi:lysozyme